jgi:hypothetical protein
MDAKRGLKGVDSVDMGDVANLVKPDPGGASMSGVRCRRDLRAGDDVLDT